MAASITLLQITSVDLMHLKARLFLERAGFNVDSSRTGPERLCGYGTRDELQTASADQLERARWHLAGVGRLRGGLLARLKRESHKAQ